MIFQPIRRLFAWWFRRRKNPVYESMTRWTVGNHTIRVWREEPFYTVGPDEEVVNKILKWRRDINRIVYAVGSMPRVAAIEVLDQHGNGGLFYPDWQ